MRGLLWGCIMHKDERDLLEVLKFELKFLEDGGYGRSPHAPRKALHIFEDSPTCINHDSVEDREPCSACALIDLVPGDERDAAIPCRHIPLNAWGETLESLYRRGNQYKTEEKVAEWLRTTIHGLEEQRSAMQRNRQQPAAGEKTKGMPLYRSLHPKCANPACPTAFHWSGGGRFFRFRLDEVPTTRSGAAADGASLPHGVRHYWLCERCCHAFTLIYDGEYGVVLEALWPKLSESDARKELSRV